MTAVTASRRPGALPGIPAHTRKRDDIQGLRAAAVLLVVLFHAGLPIHGGFLGVDMFFVISGFVIASTLLRELGKDSTVDLARFYVRRAKRLLPALAVMLTTVLVASVALAPAGIGHEASLTGLFAPFFGSNIYLTFLPTGYFAVDQQLNPLLHTWTLGVEEQFYLVFPLLLVGAWLRATTAGKPRAAPRFAATSIAALSAASLLVSLLWWHGFELGWANNPTQLAYYSSLARGWEFGLGALLALGGSLAMRIPCRAASALGLLGAGGVAAAAGGLLNASGDGPSIAAIVLACVSTAAVIVAGQASRGVVSRLLGSRALVAVGDRSYSIYLWHWPLIVFARATFPGVGSAPAIAAALSLVPAWLSYRYVENPIRFAPAIRGRRALAVALAAVAFPTAAAAAVIWVESALPDLTYPAELHADRARGCDIPAPFGAPGRPRCVWPARKPRGVIVLIGDSNAGHFTEPVVTAGNRAGFTVKVATLHGCPFVQLRVSWRLDAGCPAFDRKSLPALVREHPSLVFIAGRDNEYIDGSRAALGSLTGGRVTHNSARKARLWSAGLRSEIATLNRAGIPVVVVRPIPGLTINEQSCAPLLLWTGRCRSRVSRAHVDQQLRRAVESEDRAVGGLPAAWTLDLENELCSVTSCDARSLPGGARAYVDSEHLSVAGAMTLVPRFSSAIAAHARGGTSPRR